MQSNQIISGQTVENTLQLNQQGGGRIDISLPESGVGAEWEELDLSNLPTDFVTGDYLLVSLTISANKPYSVTSWESEPSSTNFDVSDSGHVSFITRIGVGGTNQIIACDADEPDISTIRLFILSGCGYDHIWNMTTGTWGLFNFKCITFNGKGASVLDIRVGRDNMKSSVQRILRLRV